MVKKTSNLKFWRYNKIHSFLQYRLLNDEVVLAGGALRTFLDPKETIVDYDLFILGERIKENKDEVEAKVIKFGGKKIFQCDEDELRTFELHGMKIQIISMKNKRVNSPEELMDSFDINAGRFIFFGDKLYFTKQSVKDVLTKTVSLHKITYPIASMKRLIKYSKKGYNISDASKEFIFQVANKSVDMDLETTYID